MRRNKSHPYFTQLLSAKRPVSLRHEGKYTVKTTGDFEVRDCKFEELEITENLNILLIEECAIRKIVFNGGRAAEIHIHRSVISTFELTPEASTSRVTVHESFLGEYKHAVANSALSIKTTRFRHLHIQDCAQLKIETYGSSKNKMCGTLLLEGKCPNVSIKSIYMRKLDTQKLSSDSISIKDSYISKVNFPTGHNDHSTVKYLGFHNSNIQGNVSLAHVEFKSLIVVGSMFERFELKENTWQTIELKSSWFLSLILDHLRTGSTDNRLTLEQLQIENLVIGNSILDETQINLVNLDHDGKIKLRHSSLTQAVIHSITWPRNYRIYEQPEINFDIKNGIRSQMLDHFADLREVYRQLKVLSLKADNKIDGKLFMNSELRIYYKLVTLTVLPNLSVFKVVGLFPINLLLIIVSPFYFLQIPALWPFRHSEKIERYYDELAFRWNNFGNWLILHTNSVFSGFGESLSRPILWLIAIHSLLYLALIKQFPEIGIDTSFSNALNHDWNVFWRGFDIWVNLISPVHSSKIPSLDNTSEVHIFSTIDFAMRICSGYFIFYFLKATRKFNF